MQTIGPDMEIGKRIQAIRYQNKMTLEQVITKWNLVSIPMTKITYAKLETNRMNIKVPKLVALAKIFSTDIKRPFPNYYRKSLHNISSLTVFYYFLWTPGRHNHTFSCIHIPLSVRDLT